MAEAPPLQAQSSVAASAALEREALAAMRAMRKRIGELEEERREKIAIIGLACKLPGGVEDAGSYWDLLREKTNAVQEIPSHRFDVMDVYDTSPNAPGKTNSRWAGLLDAVDEFDAGFFGISPREAENMDPQQRIFLECSWRALEDAAIAPGSLAGSATGIFVGATTHEYAGLHAETVTASEIDRYSGVGLALNAIAGRTSYVLGVHGPSMCIDAACSSSLVAVDRACRSLRDGECDMALAGGVSVVTSREALITASRSGMLSSCGRVDAFGLGADGFVRGEGCGVVVLKRLSAARRDGDRVLAVILGSAVNHDGPGSGLTVPNGQAQAALLRSALASAGIAAGAVGYVEAHGTGTRLGDPIEAEALGAVFAAGAGAAGAGARERRLAIGSVKTNLGHLESAAGIAGLIKVVLSLEHGEIPAQLHGDPPSEHVRWSDLPLEVVRDRRPWEPIGGRRIAGVSAFGFSGTNAHVIVEEAAREELRARGSRPQESVEVLALSAKSAASLQRLAERYAVFLTVHPELDWGEVCYTAAMGRTHFRHRLAVVASSGAEAVTLLRGGAKVEPGTVLCGGAWQELKAEGQASGKTGPGKARDLAEAYVRGAEPDWAAWHGGLSGGAESEARRRIRLPGYAFERERHWITGSRNQPRSARGDATGHPLLGERLRLAGGGARYEWQARPTGELTWLGEHRIAGRAILPATAYLEMLLAVAERLPGGGPLRVEMLHLITPLEAGPGGKVVQVVVEPAAGDASVQGEASRGQVRVYSLNEPATRSLNEPAAGQWRLHGKGHVSRETPSAHNAKPLTRYELDLEAVRERCPDVIEAPAFYARMEARGAEFGPRFQRVQRVWRGNGEALGEVAVDPATEAYGNRLHPACLDACLQVAAALLPDAAAEQTPGWLPARIEGFEYLSGPLPSDKIACVVHVTRLPSSTARKVEVQIAIYNQNQTRPAATLEKVTFERPGTATALSTPWIFESDWIPAPSIIKRRDNAVVESWLIVADSDNLSAPLAQAISSAGEDCFFLQFGDRYCQIDERRFVVQAHAREDYARVFDVLRDRGHCAESRPLRVMHLCSLDAKDVREATPGERLRSELSSYGSCLALVKAAIEQSLNIELTLVTRSAYSPALSEDNKDLSLSPEAAALWALARTLRAEHPELNTRCIGLAESRDSVDPSRLFDLLRYARQPEMLLRTGYAYVPRWTFRQADVRGSRPALELRQGTTGLIEDLTYAEIERQVPVDGEVEIEVLATGLNFRDVMNTLKMLGDDRPPLGGECAGVVARTGTNTSFRQGDEVVALASNAFRSYVTVRARSLVRKPPGLSFAEAACLPVAYLTAMLGLDRMAHINSGETILIHAAAGGLGLAAVRIAKARGARIYATAGTEAKRAYLRAQGVELAMNSRTLEFASQVLDATDGKGVDVVLNSLAGDFITESLRVLAKGGCFLETGKRGVLSQTEATLRRPDARYFLYDLGEEAAKDPDLVPSLLKELMDQVEIGVLSVLPVESVPFSEAAQVFRKMAQARHIGKLAVTHEPRWRLSPKPGTYLVTGGLGALGLGAVEWLFQRGARSFLLLSRHRHFSSEETLRRYRRAGAAIKIAYADCADQDALRVALEAVSPDAPLRGVVHCAGILQDRPVMDQDVQSSREVAAPKLTGAWNLHQATVGLALDFFVLFSSASAIVGSPGQANYAAANAAMDTLAHFRRANDLPALTINWGPWNAGMAARIEQADGLGSIELAAGFEIVEQLLQGDSIQATVLPIMGEDGRETAQALAANDMSMRDARRRTEDGNATIPGLLAQLAQEPAECRRSLLIDHIRVAVTAISGVSIPAEPAAETAFFDLGFDSLMVVELRNYLIKSLGRNLPATLALDYPTLGSMAEYLLSLTLPAQSTQHTPESSRSLADDEFNALSEAEAEALLLREIGRQA